MLLSVAFFSFARAACCDKCPLMDFCPQTMDIILKAVHENDCPDSGSGAMDPDDFCSTWRIKFPVPGDGCPPDEPNCYHTLCNRIYVSCQHFKTLTKTADQYCREDVCYCHRCHDSQTQTGNTILKDSFMGDNSKYTWVAIAAAATVAVIITVVVIAVVMRKVRRQTSTAEENMEIIH